jgi:hypothetical protein
MLRTVIIRAGCAQQAGYRWLNAKYAAEEGEHGGPRSPRMIAPIPHH